MAQHELAQVAEFQERFSRAQASSVVDLGWGHGLLQDRFPQSHAHNRVVVTAPVDASELLRAADRVLGGAGLAHRSIAIEDDAVGAELLPELAGAGYEATTLTTMIYRSAADPDPPEELVRAVSAQVLRPALVRDWKLDLPDSSAEVIDQLADRVALYPNGGAVEHLAVYEGSEIGARADLFFDATTGVAQFESLVTHPDYRGNGYANALLSYAARRSGMLGATLLFLIADHDDWPRDWYRRRGFVDSARSYELTLAAP